MRRMLFSALLLIASASIVSAQTHPCDLTPPTNPTVTSPTKFGFCVPLSDAQTNVLYKVYLDGATTPMFSGSLVPAGTPNTAGLVYLEAPAQTVSRGAHSFQVAPVNILGEGAKSAAYPFVVLGLPVAPTKLRVTSD